MDKRKINSCCIQTSKRLDADERKHEDSWKLSSILYNKVEEQTRCHNSCGSSEDGSSGRGSSYRFIVPNDVRKVSPSETRDGMVKDETIGSDAFIGRYGAMENDTTMGKDVAIGTWDADADTDMGMEDKGRTMGDDNSGTTIPLGAFPKKIQEMAKVLVEYENYNQDYLLVSMLSAVATAIGNTCQIRIKGCWTSSPILYVILVGRPGVGKTPPLDFAFKPIRAHDYKLLKKYKEDDEAYSLFMEKRKSRKFTYSQSEIPEIPILQRTVISDFTPEALMQAHNVNQRGIVAFVDEIMGMFNTVNQYSKGQLIEQLLTAHSGKPLDITRCSLDIPIHIEQPCINIIGTTQTKRVHELVDKGYGDNGLIDRILFAYPKRHTISPWQLHGTESNYDGRECFDLWADVVEKILALPCQYDDETGMVIPIIINFTAVAQKHLFD